MIRTYLQVGAGIIIGTGITYGVYVHNHTYTPSQSIPFDNSTTSTTSSLTELHDQTGHFTSPLIECLNQPNGDGISQLHISRFKLTDYVQSILTEKKINFLSVYVRDLNNGPWVGVNESEEFIGGSLLKVPILISIMHKAQISSTFLKQKVAYKKEAVSNIQYFPSEKEIKVGETYTVEQLLEYMIIYSDNNAAYLLAQYLGPTDLNDTFEALGMGTPDQNQPYPVNVQTYSGFFRILFNASYLNKEYSEKSLALLSKTTFNKGITEYIPHTITVSHKFGIRTDGTVNQLHDCGIVYFPKHPYLICIMSKGGTFDDLSNAISRVSQFVYNQILQ